MFRASVDPQPDLRIIALTRFPVPALSLFSAGSAAGLACYRKTRYNRRMHVISQKALRDFWTKYPDSKTALTRWFKVMEQTDFRSFDELRATFPSADQVGDWTVFNIGGNKYRLIASIHCNRGKLYVRHVLTHEQYSKGGWK
ncbi:MAG: type II toxin-antitoxin system HigB family toxin [Anaerolineae bacterium]